MVLLCFLDEFMVSWVALDIDWMDLVGWLGTEVCKPGKGLV